MRTRNTLDALPRFATALVAVAAFSAATGCTNEDDRGSATTTTDTPTTIAPTTETTAPMATTPDATTTVSGSGSGDGIVSREQAERAALDFIGEGQVTFVTEEDDRGAAWEIEITRSDGSEVDVLIAPDGTVIE